VKRVGLEVINKALGTLWSVCFLYRRRERSLHVAVAFRYAFLYKKYTQNISRRFCRTSGDGFLG